MAATSIKTQPQKYKTPSTNHKKKQKKWRCDNRQNQWQQKGI